MFLEQPLKVRVGVIYGIYLLYYTQLLSPKAKLTITIAVWQAIKETLADIFFYCYQNIVDIMHKLKRQEWSRPINVSRNYLTTEEYIILLC